MLLSADSLPGSPSAIQAMMQSLMAGPPGQQPQTPPPVQSPIPSGPGLLNTAPEMPQGGLLAPMPQSLPQRQKPGLVDRIKSHLGGNAPAGYEGLLSPEEIKSAQPSLLQMLIGSPDAPSSSQRYQGNLNHILEMKQIAAQVGEQRRLQGVRSRAETIFEPKANESIDEQRDRVERMYTYFMQHGDLTAAKALEGAATEALKRTKVDPSKVIGAGGALVGPDGKLLYQAPLNDKAADYTQYIDKSGNAHVLRKDENPPAGWKPVPLQQTIISQEGQQGRFDQGQITKGVDRFNRNIKPLRDRAAVLDQAIQTIDDAAHNPNPNVRKTLYTSAVANFIQAADQKAQIRYQLLQYFKQNVDPSISGKWEILKSRLMNGTLPGYTMEGMLQHLGNIKSLVEREIDSQRAGEVKRHPELDGELPETSEFFPISQMTGAKAPAGASLYDKYQLAPRKP